MRKQRFAKITEILLIVLLALIAGGPAFGSAQEEKNGTKGGEKAEEQENSSKGAENYKEPSQLKELIEEDKEPHILVDVRTEGEYFRGYIPTAVNIPVQIIKENPPEVPKDRLVIVYCRSGGRSAQAKKILTDLGYSRVVDFGGINSWPYEIDVP